MNKMNNITQTLTQTEINLVHGGGSDTYKYIGVAVAGFGGILGVFTGLKAICGCVKGFPDTADDWVTHPDGTQSGLNVETGSVQKRNLIIFGAISGAMVIGGLITYFISSNQD